MSDGKIQTIIFDFGNVVAYFDYSRAWRKLAGHTDLSEPEIRAAILAADLEELYETGRLSSPEFLDRLRDVGRFRCDRRLVEAAWVDIFQPNHGVARLIAGLKGRYRLQLGSNTNDLHARFFQSRYADVLGHFDAVTLSHEVGARKPRSTFFEDCVAKSGCAPAECVFIDDLPENVAGAARCGLHGIVYTDTPDLKARLRALGVDVRQG